MRSVELEMFVASHPVDHEEKGAVVGHCPHCNVKSGDYSKFASSLHVVDECVARPIEQVAGDAALGKRQLVPAKRMKKKSDVVRTATFLFSKNLNYFFLTLCCFPN